MNNRTEYSNQITRTITVIFALLITTSSFPATAQTAPLKQWDATFGGSDYDYLYSLQQTAEGGYILGGRSYSGISGDKTQASQGGCDYWIVKTDANGVKQWDATFGGSDYEYLNSLQQTADGGYILGGSSGSGISGDKTQSSRGGYDYWIVKTDSTGVKQWDARFGGNGDDYLYSLRQTADGGYILGGFSQSGMSGDKTQASQGYDDYWIVKIDATGAKQWDVRFGGSTNDDLHSLQQTADGGYILGGYSYSGIGGDKTQASQGSYDYWIVKTDAYGIKQWDARFGGISLDILWFLQQTADGGYILGGTSYSGISGDKTQASQGSWDYWIVKTDANGVKQWDARFGGSADDNLNSLQQTADGGFILGGTSFSGISGDKTHASQGGYDYWIVNTDANGARQWDATFGGSGDDYFSSLQQTADGRYILGGTSFSGISGEKTQTSQGGSDYWIVKISSECNGGITVYTDNDGDGYGNPSSSLFVEDCVVPSGYVIIGTDCNAADATIHPNATEICSNNIDDNCNGQIDEGCIICPLATSLTALDITNSSAKLTWDEVSGAAGYKIQYKIFKTNTWTKQVTTGTNLVVNDLLPNTKYAWQVKTYCALGPNIMSVWSPKQFITTASLRTSDKIYFETSLQIYPNPAKDYVTIQFTLPQSSHVYIKVYDVSGRIATLLDGDVEQGEHSVLLNTNQFSKGIYLVKIIADFGIENQKLIVQ